MCKERVPATASSRKKNIERPHDHLFSQVMWPNSLIMWPTCMIIWASSLQPATLVHKQSHCPLGHLHSVKTRYKLRKNQYELLILLTVGASLCFWSFSRRLQHPGRLINSDMGTLCLSDFRNLLSLSTASGHRQKFTVFLSQQSH